MNPQCLLLDVKLLSRRNKVLLCQLLFKGLLQFQCCFHPDFSPVRVGRVAVSWVWSTLFTALQFRRKKSNKKHTGSRINNVVRQKAIEEKNFFYYSKQKWVEGREEKSNLRLCNGRSSFCGEIATRVPNKISVWFRL